MRKTDSQYIKMFTLTQQTPLIHFQHKQIGATLRATEVKPKLDRFLIKCLENAGEELSLAWLIENGKENDDKEKSLALNYKIRIEATVT